MADSDKLSNKNQKIMDNIEKSLQTDKEKSSEGEPSTNKTVAQKTGNDTKAKETSDVKSSSSEKMTDKNSKQQTNNTKATGSQAPTKQSTGEASNSKASTNKASSKDTSASKASTTEASSSKTSTSEVSPSKANNNETATAKTSNNNSTPTKQKSNAGLWFFTIINFLLIAGVIGAGYWYYTQVASDESQQQTVFNDLKQGIDDVKQDLSTDLQSTSSRLNAIQNSVDNKLQANQEQLEQLENTVNANAKANTALADRLAEVSGRRPSDWLLAEANYLVNMAGRKLYLEKDIRTAVTLLREADARLVDLNDPSLFPVRALIAADIQTLNQVNPTSSSSIVLAIGSMLPKVSNLPLDSLQIPESKTEKDLTLSEDIADWRENLSRTWKSIVGDLITIDHVNEPLEPYLAERQQWLIEQQLKHSLSQAQTAALNEQTTLFESTMQQAIALIIEHYQLDDTRVSQFLVALQELQNTDFKRNYPEKLESQASLSDLIKRRLEGIYNNQFNEGELDTNEGNSL